MKHTFTVTHCSPSSKEGYVNRLVTETVLNVLGTTKTTKHVYMMKTTGEVAVGGKFDLDLADFQIKTYDNEYVNANGETVKGESRWLHNKELV